MASEKLCSHKFCDTKQMGRGERSLCYHIAYSTERKASEHTSASLKFQVFSGKKTYALSGWKKKKKQLETKPSSRGKKYLYRQRTSYSGACEVIMSRRTQCCRHHFVYCSSLPAFGVSHLPASLVSSVVRCNSWSCPAASMWQTETRTGFLFRFRGGSL